MAQKEKAFLCNLLKQNLGRDWTFFFRALNISSTRIEQIVAEKTSVVEHIEMLFEEWWKTKPNVSNAFDEIVEALESIERRDIIGKIAEAGFIPIPVWPKKKRSNIDPPPPPTTGERRSNMDTPPMIDIQNNGSEIRITFNNGDSMMSFPNNSFEFISIQGGRIPSFQMRSAQGGNIFISPNNSSFTYW